MSKELKDDDWCHYSDMPSPMYYMKKEEDMKRQILNILGDNHKDTIELLLATGNEPYGLYTYKGGVYVLQDGDDLDFDDLTSSEQKKVTDQVVTKNFKLNKTLQ
jgi:hypothetical protein